MIETEIKTPTFPAERVTPLKPSEALRLGRLLVPNRMLGNLYANDDKGERACALGAILIGYHGLPFEYRPFNVTVAPSSLMRKVKSPCGCHNTPNYVYWTVTHLNDHHEDWSEERIISWLETVEN